MNIYKIFQVASLSISECINLSGFSVLDIYELIYKRIKDIYRTLDPYKTTGVWGIMYDELKVNRIYYTPELKKLNISIS